MRASIGKYEIQSELGQGGMAQVYLAYDPVFRRRVAIKLISPAIRDNPALKLRFEREARLIATIEHPGIVPVYDFGEDDGQLYLVMRYMPGGSLSSLLSSGPLDLAGAVRILAQIAPALDAVHAQGIVHRDLKPANILLDGFNNAAIADFGIAHFNDATSNLTGEAVIGTPAYMSPEQARSEQALDGRSDIYALGVILFEMLTGRQPYKAATPLGLVMMHLSDPIPALNALRPDLPNGLDAVLEKAMAKDRSLRYPSATAMLADLQLLSTGLQASLPASAQLRRPLSEAATEPELPAHFPARAASLAETEAETGLPPARPPVGSARPSVGAAQPPVEAKPKPTVRLSRIWLGSAVLLLLVILTLVSLFWKFLPDQAAASTPSASLTVSHVPDLPLVSDDFSDPSSGWPASQSALGAYGYRQGQYFIQVSEPDTLLWAGPPELSRDVQIGVDAVWSSSGASGYYGLLCRIQDEQNFYYFVVTPASGEYTIGKYVNGQFNSLLAGGWNASSAIPSAGETIRLQAVCAGDRLSFYVNSALLSEVNDPLFTSGKTGVAAAALQTQAEVLFDNFQVDQVLP